jgi:hypothetical protein
VEESAREALQVRECLSPIEENVRLYNRHYEVYRQLYPAVKGLMHEVAAAADSPPDRDHAKDHISGIHNVEVRGRTGKRV